MSSCMLRLYLGASGLQIYSAPSGGQGTDLSHDLIVRMFTWLQKKENAGVVNREGEEVSSSLEQTRSRGDVRGGWLRSSAGRGSAAAATFTGLPQLLQRWRSG